MSFEEWNEQFTDNQNLNEFIPCLATTLNEFRKGISETEMDEGITAQEFQLKLIDLEYLKII